MGDNKWDMELGKPHVIEVREPIYIGEADPVNSPPHYTNGKVEIIDIIEQIVAPYEPVLGWSIGQVVKYAARAPHKGKLVEDLKKAEWYLKRAIKAAERST